MNDLRKRIITITAVFAVTILIIFIMMLSRKAGNQLTPPSSTANNTTQVQSETLTPVPGSDLTDTLNAGNSTKNKVPGMKSVKDFYDSIEKSVTRKNLNWANFDGSQKTGSPTLSDIFPSSGTSTKVRDSFISHMDQNSFDIFQCRTGNDIGQGIYLTIAYKPEYTGDTYTDSRKALEAWQPYLFKDTAEILFPRDIISESELDQPVHFDNTYSIDTAHDIEYKEAKVTINRTERKIYLGIVSDNVIATTSIDCMLSVSEQLYELVP